MTPLDDLLLLRAFVCIADCGNISAVARSMKLPQPTLSRRLKLLEDHCGVVLVRRDTHRMHLTEAGERLLEDARAMLSLADEAQQRLHEDQTGLKGHLRLFATIDGGQFTISRLIARFLKANPGVTAELAYSNRPARMIEDGCDAGVVVGEITDDSVIAKPAGKVVRYLVASPGVVAERPAVKKPADLEAWPWITLSGAQFGNSREVVLTAPKKDSETIKVSPVMMSEGVTSIREVLRAGLGIAVLPDWLVREDLVSGKLRRVLPLWNAPPLPIHVIYNSQRVQPARVRAFVAFAATYMTTEMHTAD
ncbi:LysR family transcriptional regulator [Luteolibacter sp. Populi]|uniref:LysR family transcriptional regulator n=1 Tax=Luteolibacter sp. Populi TaxID=3230487 RepID=UPI0034668784